MLMPTGTFCHRLPIGDGVRSCLAYFESLQDNLSHIGEARQAVDALREEHERRRLEELAEAQRQRQIQMQAKLDVMRHKKHVRGAISFSCCSVSVQACGLALRDSNVARERIGELFSACVLANI